jgi:hypothetical protein
MSKMVDSNKRLNIIPDQNVNYLLIMRYRLFIPKVFFRLYSAPFNRKAIGIDPEFVKKTLVVFVERIMVSDIRIGVEHRIP